MEFIGMIYKFLFRLMFESAWRAVEKFQFVNWENTPGIINENGNHFEKKRWKIFFFYFFDSCFLFAKLCCLLLRSRKTQDSYPKITQPLTWENSILCTQGSRSLTIPVKAYKINCLDILRRGRSRGGPTYDDFQKMDSREKLANFGYYRIRSREDNDALYDFFAKKTSHYTTMPTRLSPC